MPDEEVASANQQIDTKQPRVLKGLKLSGVHKVATVQYKRESDGKICTVNADDYDREIHGPKITKKKIPARKKAAKKKGKKKKVVRKKGKKKGKGKEEEKAKEDE